MSKVLYLLFRFAMLALMAGFLIVSIRRGQDWFAGLFAALVFVDALELERASR